MSLTDESLVRAVRELAAENPDYVYVNGVGKVAGAYGASCFYVHHKDGALAGGCLIGQAAIRSGVPIGVVATWDDADQADAKHVLPGAVSDRVREWANWVQYSQDAGKTWGTAVSFADESEGDPLD